MHVSFLKKIPGRRRLALALSVLLLAALLVAVKNDYGFYSATIARVTQVQTSYDKSEAGPRGETERYYKQALTLVIMNGPEKGSAATAANAYAESLVSSEKYAPGDELFVTLSAGDAGLTAVITGEKRDAMVALLAGLFVLGMLWVSRARGLLTVLSLLVNLSVFALCMRLYVGGVPLSRLRDLMIGAFLVTTLVLAGGLHKKTFGAILASLITLVLTALLYRGAVLIAGEPPYELMDYIFVPEDLEEIFLAGVIIGCLGAVMDVAITVCAAVSELSCAAGPLPRRNVVRAVRGIGHDIMGTMIGVLLFSYLSGSLPLIVVKVMNGYTLASMARFHAVFELIRFLVGSIGIVLAIPVSGAVAALLLGRGKA